jgi:ketosteroid isomerase-like protein
MKTSRTKYAAAAALLFCTVAAAAQPGVPADLAAMVETERDFARTALVKGIRDAFLEFFADDAIAFAPEPVSAKERLRSRPAQPPSALELKWEPRLGDVAASGEIGWLTGPSTFVNRTTSPSAPQYSNYLSVWRKEPDGRWRVFIDFGIDVPGPAQYEPGFTRFRFDNRYRGPDQDAAAAGTLMSADRELNAALEAGNVSRAYAARLAPLGRLNRNGVAPLVGASAIAAWLEANTPALSARTTASFASRAGDLGYAYGTYEAKGDKPESGAYLRVWTRDRSARWWIVAEVMKR